MLNIESVFRTLVTVYLASGLAKVLGHSMLKYIKAKAALKTVFSLIWRVPLIDVGSVKGIALVCYVYVRYVICMI